MSWAKADDRYDDTSKIKKAWRLSGYAVGLHWMSVTSCARHESDGLVDPEWLAERLGVIPPKDAKRAVEALVSLGLYEELPAGETRTVFDKTGAPVTLGPVTENTYIVHDYLQYQDSAVVLEGRRAAERLRKAIAARAKELGLKLDDYRKTADFRTTFPPASARKPPGIRTASEDPDPTRPDPTRPDLLTEPPLAPPASPEGNPGDPDSASPKRPNSRAHGTNPRAVDESALERQAVEAGIQAVSCLVAPSDDQRAEWERLRTALVQSVGGKAVMEAQVADLALCGIESGVLVIDGTEDAWGWARHRLAGPLRAWSESLGVDARFASADEHEGLRVAA